MSELIERSAVIDAMKDMYRAAEKWGRDATDDVTKARAESCMASLVEIKLRTEKLPAVQPEIIRCKDCIYYDLPHVENNGVRYEYAEMPKEAFDVLGTGLVSMEYGINIGGRCCVDYYCKSYSDDKRVYVREDNYCGRAERRTE